MLRARTILPLLISSLAMPAVAGEYSICLTASNSISCVIEQAEFARQQNELVAASIANVERARAFERARNAEIAASMAAVNAARQRQLEVEQNALADAAMAAAGAERDRRFVAHQNELATASLAAVATERKRQLALSLTQCKSHYSRTPRCLAERAQRFAAHQNALATASMERVAAERARAFAAARNAEIVASLATVAAVRAAEGNTKQPASVSADEYAELTSHCVRSPDSPRCEAEHLRAFAAARNAEIDSSMVASAKARAEARDEARVAEANARAKAAVADALMDAAQTADTQASGDVPASTNDTGTNTGLAAYGDSGSAPLETGAIGSSVLPAPTGPTPADDLKLQHRISDEPCSGIGTPFGPYDFNAGLDIDAAMKPSLDRLVEVARTCPGVSIEAHGYSDATASPFFSRTIAHARAQAIADYLIANGVDPHRLTAVGHASHEAQLPYSFGMTSAYSRRVEITVRDPGMASAARRVMWDLAELLDPTYVPAVADLSP